MFIANFKEILKDKKLKTDYKGKRQEDYKRYYNDQAYDPDEGKSLSEHQAEESTRDILGYTRFLTESLLPNLDYSHMKILEIGPRRFEMFYYFLEKYHILIEGVDILKQAFEKARREGYEDQLFELDAHFLDLLYNENDLDLIYSHHCFEHMLDLPLVLQQCYKALKPGGYLYFSVPVPCEASDRGHWWSILHDGSITKLCKEVGFIPLYNEHIRIPNRFRGEEAVVLVKKPIVEDIYYNYIYTICLWDKQWDIRGRDNLREHIKFLNNYKYLRDSDKTVLLVAAQRGEDSRVSTEVEEIFSESTKSNKIDMKLLVNKNWGMTIGALWDTWKYCESEEILSEYFVITDDDYLLNHWEDRQKLLDEGNIYVGMFESMSMGTSVPKEVDEKYRRFFAQGYKDVSTDSYAVEDEGVKRWLKELNADIRRWTDGGHYFFRYESLAAIEMRIGVFTKAPQDEEITLENDGYGRHGIRYGEVGFPTELWSQVFRFTAFKEATVFSSNGEWKDYGQWHLNDCRKVSENFYRDKIE